MALVLAVLMIIGTLPANQVLAATTEDKFNYTINGSNATITGYTNKSVGELVIPATIDGFTVTEVAANAFSWNNYPNLNEITVLGEDVVIGDKMCGYDASGSRNDQLELWGAKGSTINTYADSKLFQFNEIAKGITDITTEQDTNGCYTGRTFTVSVDITDKTSSDIAWSSENAEQVTITPFKTEISGTVNRATATVHILSKGDGSCKIYAKTRSGYVKEMTLTLLQSASSVNVEAEIYYYDKDSKTFTKATDIPSTYYANDIVTADVGTYLWFRGTTSGSADDYAILGISGGLATYMTLAKDETGNDRGLYANASDSMGYMFALNNTTGKSYTEISYTSAGMNLSKSVRIKITQPALGFQMSIGDMQVDDEGGCFLIQGASDILSAKLRPKTTTDEVEWSSDNSDVATIAEDGTVTTHNHGTATITCKIKNTLGNTRTLSQSFELLVKEKHTYTDIYFVDNEVDKNKITAMDMEAGTTKKLLVSDSVAAASGSEANEPIFFSSSNEKVAKVDSEGNVTTATNTNGTATIQVSTESGKLGELVITSYVKATTININGTFTIPVGQSRTVSYTLTPSNSQEQITWTPTDKTKVSIVDNGNQTVTITTLAAGTSTIVGETKSGGAKKTFNVVIPAAIHMDTMGISVTDTSSYLSTYVDAEGTTVYRVEKDKKIILTPTFTPETANDGLSWTHIADDASIIETKTIESNLEVSAKGVGITTVTLNNTNGKTAKCKIEVEIPSTALRITTTSGHTISNCTVAVGGTNIVRAMLTPSYSTDSITWTKSNNNISLSTSTTVTNGNVIISGLSTGTTTLRATSESGQYAEITVTVNIPTTSIDFMDGTTSLTELSVLNGSTKSLSLNTAPANTTDTTYTWTSKYSRVEITPSADGKTAQVKGIIAGTDTITVTSNSGFTKAIGVTIQIPAVSIDFACTQVTINKGSKVTATATVGPTTANDGITYTTNKDGVVSLSPSANGKTVEITGIGVGTVRVTATTGSGMTDYIDFEVKTVDAKALAVTGINASYTYKGSAWEPLPTVKYTNGTTVTLTKGTDYDVRYENNTDASETAKVIITCKGKYSGTIEKIFTINPKTSVSSMTCETSNTRIYDGTAFKPEIIIKNGSNVLVDGKDYTLVYDEAINVKSGYKVTATFKGNYSGTRVATFNVTAKPVATDYVLESDFSVSGISTSGYTYTGKPITPNVVIKDGSKILAKNTDYTITYSNNVNVSKETSKVVVSINGKGNYKGSAKIYFTIKPASISKATVTPIADKTYTGNKVQTSIVLKLGSTTVSTSNYTVTYYNNVNTGRATVRLVGKGNYTGSKTVYFKILPKMVSGVKQTGASKSSVKLSWTPSAGAVSGYMVYKYYPTTKKSTYVGATNKTSYTVSRLSSGKDYYFVVRAYKTVGSAKYVGVNSTSTMAKTSTAATSIRSLKSRNKGQAVATWKKVTGANQYQVYVSTNGKKYKLQTTTSSLTTTISGLKSRKYVYVKVRCVRNINGKSYTSSYSKVKKVKVK